MAEPARPQPRRPRIGLALGSGAARGWAHIGVLRALADDGLVPDVISGASIGAFVGAAAACGELDALESWVGHLSWKDVLGFFDIGLNGGLIKGEKLMDFFSSHFTDRDFHQLPVPFACVATDLGNGKELWLKEGSVAAAVRASIALPGLFSPVEREGRHLVDGGLVNPVPVSLCRALGAEVVIAVDLGSDLVGKHLRGRKKAQEKAAEPGWSGKLLNLLPGRNGGATTGPGVLDVIAASINIMQVRVARSRLAGDPAEVLVAPRLAQLGLLDFHRGAEAIAEGWSATKLMLPLLHNALDNYR